MVDWLDRRAVRAAGCGVQRLLVFSRHAGAAASGDASPLDRMDVSRSGANSQALRKGRSPGRVLHRRACRCCCCSACSRYDGLLTRFSNSTFISPSRVFFLSRPSPSRPVSFFPSSLSASLRSFHASVAWETPNYRITIALATRRRRGGDRSLRRIDLLYALFSQRRDIDELRSSK